MSPHVTCTTANAFVDCHIWRIFPMNGSSFNRAKKDLINVNFHKTQFLIEGNGYTLRIYKGNICHFFQIVYFQTLMISSVASPMI